MGFSPLSSHWRKTTLSPFSYENFVNKSDQITKFKKKVLEGHYKDKSERKFVWKKLRMLHTKSYAKFFRKLPSVIKVVYKTDVTLIQLHDFIYRFENHILNHGFEEACKQFKSLQGFMLRDIIGHKSEPLKRFSIKGGIPRCLRTFINIIQGPSSGFASLLLILDLPKLWGLGRGIPDPVSITEPGVLPPDDFTDLNNCKAGRYFERLGSLYNKNDPFFDALKRNWIAVLKRAFPSSKLEERRESMRKHSSIHVSTKNGPNGVCLVGSPRDYIAVRDTCDFRGKPLLDTISELSEITDNKELTNVIDTFGELSNNQLSQYVHTAEGPYKPPITGKLSIKQEVFGKSRLIAIVDFFSQSVLKPLHEVQFDWLSKQAGDGTFNQGHVSEQVRILSTVLTSTVNALFSLDLTTATDRLPIDLQFEVMNQQFGYDVAFKWYTLCRERPFENGDTDVYYSVGQPMGTYSSWSNLATLNHLLARAAIRLSGDISGVYVDENQLPIYYIIGDDFVCKGEFVASYYKRILTLMGVKISELKGFTPFTSKMFDLLKDKTDLSTIPNSVELAKRVFVSGVEITPIRPLELVQGLSEPVNFKPLIDKLFDRVGALNSDQISRLSSLTSNPKMSLTHLLLPFRPSKFLLGLFSQCGDYRNENFNTLLGYYDTDGTALFSKYNDLIGVIRDFQYGNIGEIEDNIYNVFASTVISKFSNLLRSMKRFIYGEAFKDVSDRRYQMHTPVNYLQGHLLMIDYLMLLIYKKLQYIFNDMVDLLHNSLEDKQYIVKVCTLLMSVYDYELLLKGRTFVNEVESDGPRLSRFISEMEGFVLDNFNYLNTRFKTPISLRYEDVEELIVRNNELKSDTNWETIKARFSSNTAEEAQFIRSREGFKSLLSDPVAKAMEALSIKFGKELIEGPSLLKAKVSLDNKLSSVILESTASSFISRNSNYFKSRESELINIVGDKITINIMSIFDTPVTV
jgi:hypothetical protein